MGAAEGLRQLAHSEGLSQLRDPDFARLFGARLVSSFGSAMAPVAMAFGVLELTGSPRAMGYVIAAQSAAQVAVQLFGGALADRGSRKRQMIRGDLLAAAAQVAIAFLLFQGDERIPVYCALMALNGIAFALLWPATVGIVPQIVPAERLQPANALLSLAQSSAFGLGGAAAGVLVAVAGAEWAIAVDACTFLASAALLAGLRPRPQQRSAAAGMWEELRDGWREFTSHRWLWAIVAQFSLVVAAWQGGFFIAGPVVAKAAMQGAATWAWVAGALGAGLLVGGWIGLRVPFGRPMLVATLCVLTFALPLLLLIAPAPVPLVVAGAFVAGIGGELFGVLWNTALHTHVAPEALSRVSAYDILGSIALAPLGEALAGPLIEAAGTGTTLKIGAALIVVPTLLVLGVPEVRNLRSGSGDAAEDEVGRSQQT